MCVARARVPQWWLWVRGAATVAARGGCTWLRVVGARGCAWWVWVAARCWCAWWLRIMPRPKGGTAPASPSPTKTQEVVDAVALAERCSKRVHELKRRQQQLMGDAPVESDATEEDHSRKGTKRPLGDEGST